MGRSVLLFFVAFLGGIFIQATLLHSVLPDMVAPDILMILAVFLGLRARNAWGALGAFTIGLGADFATGKFLGPFAAGSVVAFATTVFFANHFFSEKWFTVSITSFLASLTKNLTQATILCLFTDINLFSFQSLPIVLVEAMLTAVVAPLIVRLIGPRYSSSGGYSASSRTLRRA